MEHDATSCIAVVVVSLGVCRRLETFRDTTTTTDPERDHAMSSTQTIENLTATVNVLCKHVAALTAGMGARMTQKEVATAINEKPQVVAEYESGKAIPNPQIISKLERHLGCKLPRPGKSVAPPKAGGTGTAAKTAAANTSGGLTRGGPPKRR